MDHNQYNTNESERKPQKHLTMDERGIIQGMKSKGCPNREIARYLNCSPSTIANELKRGTPVKKSGRGRRPCYSAKRGNAAYKTNRKNSRKPHKIQKCYRFIKWVVQQIRQRKWSFDACAGYAKKYNLFPANEMVCAKTLYNEAWSGALELSVMELPEALKRKKHRKKVRRNRKNYGTSIEKRPEIAASRREEGHWEVDTVVGKRKGKGPVILTLLEKKTQYYLAIRIAGKNSKAVNRAFRKLRMEYGEQFSKVFQTITADNGSEFAELAKIEKWGTKVYFAHPCSSWERPQNERHNRQLRTYIPKGLSIEQFSDDDVSHAMDEINALPRRRLDFCIPEELFETFLDSVYAL